MSWLLLCCFPPISLTWKGRGEMKSFPVTVWTLTQLLWTIHTVCSTSSSVKQHYKERFFVFFWNSVKLHHKLKINWNNNCFSNLVMILYHLSCSEEQQSYTIRPADRIKDCLKSFAPQSPCYIGQKKNNSYYLIHIHGFCVSKEDEWNLNDTWFTI